MSRPTHKPKSTESSAKPSTALVEDGPARYQIITVALVVAFILTSSLLAHFSLKEIKQETTLENHKLLAYILKTADGALNVWVEKLNGHINHFSHNEQWLLHVNRQLGLAHTPETLKNSPYLQEIKKRYNANETFGSLEFYIVSPDHINIAASYDSAIGKKNSLTLGHIEKINHVFAGKETLLSPQLITEIQDQHVAYIATPLFVDQKAVAALLVQLTPNNTFSNFIAPNNVIDHGLTYGFAADGIPLQRHVGTLPPYSRQIAQSATLIRNALISAFKQSTNAINNEQHYTITDTQQYINHKGMEVLGAFLWDKRIGIGLASEIAYDAAMRNYNDLRTQVIFLYSSLVFMALLVMATIFLTARNSNQQLIRANKELGKNVNSNSAELNAVLSCVPEALIHINECGHIISATPQSSTLFKYSHNELLGMRFEELIPTFCRQQDLISTLINTGKRNHPLLILSKAGDEIPVQINIKSFKEDDQWISVASLRDISEQIHIEQEKENLHNQLLQATKMETLGHLTGGIAHDFNNILASIMGFTELSRRKAAGSNPVLERYLESIQQSSERGSELIKQMLTFSRSDTHKQESISPLPAIKEATRLLRATIPASVHISLDARDKDLAITVDPTQLHQMIMNLVINAKDALQGRGNIDIAVSRALIQSHCNSCQETVSSDYVVIGVKDDGPGIATKNLPRIFDPFFTTKEVGQGTGMGLYTVHNLVHSYGGHIVVESALDQGTSIKLLFPESSRLTHGHLETEINDSDLIETSDTPPPRSKGHIILVDDEPTITAFMKELIEEWGYEVSAFNHPHAAMDVLADGKSRFDLIISDQTMPDLLGTDLCAICQEQYPDLPFVLYSGYSEEVNERNYHKFGIAAFFTKPLNNKVLMEALEALLNPASHPATRK